MTETMEPDQGPDQAPGQPTDPEDRKIITLATAARARTGAEAGACLRDTDGRTYAASSVRLPSLSLSAVTVAVAMAVSSGASGVEAVAVCGAGVPEDDLRIAAELAGHPVPFWVVDLKGAVLARISTP